MQVRFESRSEYIEYCKNNHIVASDYYGYNLIIHNGIDCAYPYNPYKDENGDTNKHKIEYEPSSYPCIFVYFDGFPYDTTIGEFVYL